jgi:DNA-binding LacI/PurR family transcriptional regulator
VRWSNIERVAEHLGLTINPRLVTQLEGDSPSPQLGYMATKMLLASGEAFSALFSFNDISAMGAIRALREAGLHVPEDVSVVGFDDIQSAAFQNPALTTVRQPLREMGRAAAEILLKRINRPGSELHDKHTVEPQLVIRETTGPAPNGRRVKGKQRR